MINAEQIMLEPDVVVGIVQNAEGKIAMIRRNCPPNYGMWALPAGERWEWEDPKVAVEREIYEETGIVVQGTTFLEKQGKIWYYKAQELLQHETIEAATAWEISGFGWVDSDNPLVWLT